MSDTNEETPQPSLSPRSCRASKVNKEWIKATGWKAHMTDAKYDKLTIKDPLTAWILTDILQNFYHSELRYGNRHMNIRLEEWNNMNHKERKDKTILSRYQIAHDISTDVWQTWQIGYQKTVQPWINEYYSHFDIEPNNDGIFDSVMSDENDEFRGASLERVDDEDSKAETTETPGRQTKSKKSKTKSNNGKKNSSQ